MMMMSKHDNIRGFVEDLFKEAPYGGRVNDLKEELILNLTEKYEDLIAEGLNENDAYAEIIKGIGEIDELLADIKPHGGGRDEDPNAKAERERKERLRSLLAILAFGLYFLSFIVFLFPDFLYISRSNSVPSALVLVGIATGILIYTAISLPKYKKADDTLIEDFKSWRNTQNNLKKIRNTLISIIWCATPVLYFIISFNDIVSWRESWLIFLFAVIVQQAVMMFFNAAIWRNTDKYARKFKNSLISLIWCSTPFLYFIISFGYWNWAISWIIFPIAAVATQIVNVLFDVKKK